MQLLLLRGGCFCVVSVVKSKRIGYTFDLERVKMRTLTGGMKDEQTGYQSEHADIRRSQKAV